MTLTLIQWPGMTLTSFRTLTSDKSNQVKTDVQVAKLAFSMRWPWPWPNDLDTKTWPRYHQDVAPHQNEVSMSTPSKVVARTQTHRHDENITSTAYAGGKNLYFKTKCTLSGSSNATLQSSLTSYYIMEIMLVRISNIHHS